MAEMTVASLPSLEDITAAGRLGDVLAAVELQERPLPPTRRDRVLPDRLRLVYLVARVGFGESERVLITQARHLGALGANVTVLSRAHPDEDDPGRAERRLGTRARLRHVPYGEAITDAVPPCDLIVAGSWEFVLPARMLGFAPVVLFERGELHMLGEVPPHFRVVVEASVRAASVTFAHGGPLKDALKREYGVETRDAPGVVDTRVFGAGSAKRAPGSRRGGVVLSGSDVVGADRLDDARHVAEALRASHPDRAVTLLTPRPELGAAFAEVVGAPSDEELARRLRSARLYVSTTERAAVDLGPLEAMAAGTPVVAASHPSVLSYAVNGQNALLAPAGDVAALVESARRVLDDDGLATRLAEGGLVTAAAHSWPVLGPELLAQYSEVAGTAPTKAPLGGFAVSLGGLHFVRQGDAARLRNRLGACTTREVALPVSQPAFGPFRTVRWRVVARRADGEAGVTRVNLPARSDLPIADAPYQAELELLRDGFAEEALEGFAARCESGNSAEQAVLGRWVSLSLIEAGRPDDADEVAAAFAHDFPTHPDYVLLTVCAARAAGRPLEISGPLERVRVLGVGARYDEWFDDPLAILAELLGAEL
jgi:hypothetical protein